MHRTPGSPRLVAALLTLTVLITACGDTDSSDSADSTDDTDSAFCTAMEQVAKGMAPDPEATPDDVRATFDEVVVRLEQAEQNAPAAIAQDVTDYATAISGYVTALGEVDYDLAALFSTPEGTKLAEDTSHALTPAVVEHMVGPCGIALE